MVYDRINNPAAGGANTDICSHSYCCTNTYTHSSWANGYSDADADTYTYTYTYTDTYASMRRAGLRRREHSY